MPKKLKTSPACVIGSLPAMDIDTLVERLQKANWMYHNEQPIMTDEAFDRGLENLRKLSPAHPFLKLVGASPASAASLLPVIMGSLDKVRMGEGALKRWMRRDNESRFVVSEKLDGLSALFVGRPSSACRLYLRGDGVNGVDVSRALSHISAYAGASPKCIVRGELVLPSLSTPAGSIGRSLVNGWLHRSLKGELVEQLRDIHFVGYQVIEPANMTRQDQLRWLVANGFRVPHWENWERDWPAQPNYSLTEENALKYLEARKAASAYPLDGIVIGTDVVPESVGGGEAKNPTDAIAFKAAMDDQREETNVVSVEWNLSRQGFWIPRIEIEPVEIGGANIQWLSGHNASIITAGVVGPGARIIVRRSGDVIPTLEKVLVPAPGGASTPAAGTWEWDATRVHARVVGEGGEEASAVALLHALQTLGIDGIGPGLVKKMVDGGFNTMRKLYDASRESLATVIGPGRAASLATALRSVRGRVSACDLLVASNRLPRGVGERKLRTLFAREPNPRLWKREDFPHMAGWSTESLDELFAALPAALEWEVASFGTTEVAMPAAAAAPAAPVAQQAAQQPKGSVVFSGVRDKEFEGLLRSRGWTVEDNITKATTVLVVGDLNATTGKIKTARTRGIKICLLSDFRSQV